MTLQRYDEAVKQFNESKAQANAEAAPRGGVGVTASMIVLDSEECEESVLAHSVRASDSNQYCAMVAQPDMRGEITECQVPSATVSGPAGL